MHDRHDTRQRELYNLLTAPTPLKKEVDNMGKQPEWIEIISKLLDELETSKKIAEKSAYSEALYIFKFLSPFEQKVAYAIIELFKQEHKELTISMIYKQMQHDENCKPSKKQFQKIKSVFDNLDIFEVLPIDITERSEYGKKGDFFITYSYESDIPLINIPEPKITFQITKNSTTIEKFLRLQIMHDKNSISYISIFTECRIETATQRCRAFKTVRKILDYYTQTGLIENYQEKDNVLKAKSQHQPPKIDDTIDLLYFPKYPEIEEMEARQEEAVRFMSEIIQKWKNDK